MADPIKHDTASGLATAGMEAVKGGAFAWLATVAVGALGGFALTMLSAAFIGAAVGDGAPAMMGEMFTGGLGVLTSAATIVGGFIGGTFGTIPAALGGLFGLAKGSSRVNHELSAYKTRVEMRSHTKEHAEVAGVQQGYLMGFEEGRARGQNEVVTALQMQAMKEQQQSLTVEQTGTPPQAVAAAAPQPKEEAPDKSAAACKTCGPHTEAVVAKRAEQAAAAGQQIGT